MKFVHIQTLTLLLLVALLLLSAPAVADSIQTTVTLTACEVEVVKDSSAQGIVFTVNGESGKTSAFISQGGEVTIEIASIPSGKNLVVSREGKATLTKSGMTITVSNVQSELVTVTLKLVSTGTGGGGGRPSIPSTPDVPDTPVTPDKPDEPEIKSHTAFVGDNGEAHFKDHEVIIRVTVPEKYAGKKIEVIDGASVDAAEGMDIYHQADIHLHFELEDGDKALVHFQIPASEFKAKGLTENDACLYHYDEDSGWTKLPTWHVTSGEYLIYESETGDFSPFAIVFEENSAMSKDTEEPVTPAELPVYLGIALLTLILLAGIGTVILRRRKNVEKQ